MSKKVLVYTTDLKLGMYVAELDRPWVDTPFLFQGLYLEKIEDIQGLREVCEHVYVDPERSKPGTVEKLLISGPNRARKKISIKPRKIKRFSEDLFRQSLLDAHHVYKDARGWVDTMLEDSRLGSSIDTEKARILVTELAEQVISNPDALMWLTHLRTRDEYTATHCVNVCILALSFGRALELDSKQLQRLGMGALLHDIGKMRVPDDILNKPARLTKDEFEIMMQHPVIGHALLKDDSGLEMEILNIVLHHHERLDGGGYPLGMKDVEIPLLTRITSIVDVYDAITSDRCYHDAIAPALALENLFRWSSGNFDISLLEKFIKCLGIYPIGSVVRLNTNEVGVVVATDGDHRIRPIVLLAINAEGKAYMPRKLVNLSSDVWEKTGKQILVSEVLEPGSLGIELQEILREELNFSEDQISKYEEQDARD